MPSASARNKCVVRSYFVYVRRRRSRSPRVSRSDRLQIQRNNCNPRSHYESTGITSFPSSMNAYYNWRATFATPVTRRQTGFVGLRRSCVQSLNNCAVSTGATHRASCFTVAVMKGRKSKRLREDILLTLRAQRGKGRQLQRGVTSKIRSVISIDALRELADATVSNLSGQCIILWRGFIYLSRGQCGLVSQRVERIPVAGHYPAYESFAKCNVTAKHQTWTARRRSYNNGHNKIHI